VQECPHPLDLGYVAPALRKIFTLLLSIRVKECDGRPCEIRLAHETEPNRIVAFSRAAHVTGLAQLCPSSYLSVHPLLGPWLSYRALVILDARCDPEDVVDIATFTPTQSAHGSSLWGWSPIGDAFAPAVFSAGTFSQRETAAEWKWGKSAPWLYDEEARGRIKAKIDQALEINKGEHSDKQIANEVNELGQPTLSPASAAW